PFDAESGKGNGFVFEDYTVEALSDAVAGAVTVFRQDKPWRTLVKNAMESDFSWSSTAKKYSKIYESVKRRHFKISKV
ncbi:MAG TPA: starch synthase, partial [Candidatus Omnitrophota bacterium]|nr:starch synthase [Candidatus Omnitrophota bacterium]